jgi:hypothetical protein
MERITEAMQDVRDAGRLSPCGEKELYKMLEEAAREHDANCDERECVVCSFMQCPFQDPRHTSCEGCPSCWTEINVQRLHEAFDEARMERKMEQLALADDAKDHGEDSTEHK